MFEKIKNNFFIIIIFLTSLILAFQNYSSGTFLSGWDTLHPEFNFPLNFERAINGVFREEQGLGAVAGHSHMADLPRILLLYLTSFILPVDFLRYFYIFLNLIIGPLGMYFFLQRIVIKNKFGSFLGSLFYLLNLGSMQQFVVPFEMFATQYGILPWLFLTATEYFQKPNKKRLLLFSIVTLFAAPMAYASTLWYIYFGCLTIYLISFTSFQLLKKKFSDVKKLFILLFLTLLINSFWILPNLYFLTTSAFHVPAANINKLFSPQAFLYNKEFGNLKDISLLKTFLFDWNVYASNSTFTLLLNPWVKHLSNPSIKIIGFIFPFLAFLGIIFSYKSKNKIALSFIPLLLASLFFLLNENSPTGPIYKYFKDNIPLFGEALRFPGNKILGIFTFIFAVYVGLAEGFLIDIFKKSQSLTKIRYGIAIIFSILLFIYMLPGFRGNFISTYMRIEIPADYFKMFKWFEGQENGKIANLPIHSVWGWSYYDWGYQGAEFLSFGIKQPILQRDFDRWNSSNEQYYREMSQAIYSQDAIKLSNVLKKYDIKYILLDKSVIAPEQKTDSRILFFPEIDNLLDRFIDVQKVAQFGNLFIYETGSQKSDIRVIRNPITVASNSVFYDDFAYSKYKDYLSYSDPAKNMVVYPFGNILNNQNLIALNKVLPVLSKTKPTLDVTLVNKSINDCPPYNSPNNVGLKKNIVSEDLLRFIRYTSSAGSFCDHFSYPDFERNQSYIISVLSRNKKGLPLKLCVSNYLSKRCDLFTQLGESANFKEENFLLPPIDQGKGFDVNISNFAIKGSPSINDLKSINIIPFDYSKLSQIEAYTASDSNGKSVIVYSQSFDSGWKAYEVKSWLDTVFPFIFGKEIKQHVLVNNWANGWIINSEKLKVKSEKLVIIFWPQYLEYLGFALLIGTFVWLFVPIRRKSKQGSSL